MLFVADAAHEAGDLATESAALAATLPEGSCGRVLPNAANPVARFTLVSTAACADGAAPANAAVAPAAASLSKSRRDGCETVSKVELGSIGVIVPRVVAGGRCRALLRFGGILAWRE